MELDYRSAVRDSLAQPKAAPRWVVWVMVLMLLVAGFVIFVPALGGRHPSSRRTEARAYLSGLGAALEFYHQVYSGYPTTSEGLEALTRVNPPMLVGPVKKDPWGNAYRYVSPAGGKGYRVSSDGADGVAGTGDDLVGE